MSLVLFPLNFSRLRFPGLLALSSQLKETLASSSLAHWLQTSSGQRVEAMAGFTLSPKSLQMVTAAMKLKDASSLEGLAILKKTCSQDLTGDK